MSKLTSMPRPQLQLGVKDDAEMILLHTGKLRRLQQPFFSGGSLVNTENIRLGG